MKHKLMLVDGFSLIFRSYWGFINNPVRNPDGQNISAVFGFFNAMVSLLEKNKPDSFAVVMDSPVPTFRHEKYPEYKANRDRAPDDLVSQVPLILEILKAMSICVIFRERYEADDLMACAAKKGSSRDMFCIIVSADKDLMQTVTDNIHMLRPEKGDYLDMGPDQVVEKMGVRPDQIVDYLSLVGDSSDNIPGVKGIGQKTAVTLLQKFETLDGIYGNIDSCSKGQILKLNENKKNAYLSQKLVLLNYDMEEEIQLDDFRMERTDPAAAVDIIQSLGMNQLGKRLQTLFGKGENSAVDAVEPVSKKSNYTIINTLEELDEWIQKIKESKWFAMDVETDNIDAMLASPVGFSLSTASCEGCYIPLKAEGGLYLSEEGVKARLERITTDDTLHLIGHNFKYDYKVLKKWGLKVSNLFFDTMIAAWVLDTTAPGYSMDILAERHFDYTTIRFHDIVPKGGIFSDISLETAAPYAAEDADITFRFYELFEKQLKSRNLLKLFYELEMPMVQILAEIEYCGILLDTTNLKKYSRELEINLAGIQDRIFIECGREFNINSTKQLQEILFEERKLQPVKKTKTGYSTDSSVLEILSREDIVPEMILRYRTLSKLKSTYVDALPGYVNPDTKRVHTQLMQTGTATGRLSSKDPNLQNIPVKMEEGRRIRNAFYAAEGNVLLSADYSQIELVLLAHLSGDIALQKAFISNNDVHTETGSLIFSKPASDVTKEERQIAKTINFGVMYGMSAFRLSRELGIPRTRADEFIKSYFEKYSGIQSFIDKTVATTEREGKIATIMGRERFIPAINSRNKTEKSGAERMAVNTPIQGSAADIVKLAMIRLSNKLAEKKLASRMILQVHDELIFEVPESEIELMRILIKNEMEGALKLSIPLRATIETGKKWGDIH